MRLPCNFQTCSVAILAQPIWVQLRVQRIRTLTSASVSPLGACEAMAQVENGDAKVAELTEEDHRQIPDPLRSTPQNLLHVWLSASFLKRKVLKRAFYLQNQIFGRKSNAQKIDLAIWGLTVLFVIVL